MKHHLKSSEKEKIVEIVSLYLYENVAEIEFAYLFGSFLKGGSFSDIDVAIVTNSELKKPLDFEFDLENRLEKAVKYSVDVRILNKAPLSFCYNAIRHGILIVDRNRSLRTDFESRILRQYFDFAPFRRRYLTEVTNAPL